MPSLLRILNAVRRRVLIHRRGLLAVAVGVLAWSLVSAARPADPPGATVWTAERDLPSGTVLGTDDLTRTEFPTEAAPKAQHDLRSLIGRTLAAPVGEGEVVTRTATISNERLDGYPGRSAVPIRIPDADTVGLLRPGDHVDLVGNDLQDGGPGRLVAQDAVVLALPRSSPSGSGPVLSGRLVVFAVPSDQVTEVAAAASALFLTVIWNR